MKIRAVRPADREEWAYAQGCTEFASDTTIDNEASRKAHLACGFADAGLIRCFIKTLHDDQETA